MQEKIIKKFFNLIFHLFRRGERGRIPLNTYVILKFKRYQLSRIMEGDKKKIKVIGKVNYF